MNNQPKCLSQAISAATGKVRIVKIFLLMMLLCGTNIVANAAPPFTGKDANTAQANPLAPKAEMGKTKAISFLENKGQVRDQNNNPRTDIQYKIEAAPGLNIFIGNAAIHYQFSKPDKEIKQPAKEDRMKPGYMPEKINYNMYRMDVELVGADKNAQVVTEQQQDYSENHITSGLGQKGVTAHSYNKITYKNVYPDIDWVLYVTSGKLKHEFVVREGGKVSDIKLKYGGATGMELDNNGALTATTPQGTITEDAPDSWQRDGKKVSSRFILRDGVLSYETGSYSGELVIDPSLAWATYFGGSLYEGTYGVVADVSGNVYTAGYTGSASGIATTGAYQTTFGGNADILLAKFNSSGAIQWATYYGDAGSDVGQGIAIDGSANVYITGYTQSTSGIATSGAYQTTEGDAGAQWDAFLVKFNSSGDLQWATYYGGSGEDDGYGIAADGSGNVYITGRTSSTTGIATSGTYQTVEADGGGSYDAFLAKFNSSGAIQWATYFGGSGYESGQGLATDGLGNVYMTGVTTSTTGIATIGAYQTQAAFGNQYPFLAKFNSSGAIQWSTYYGGSSGDYGYGVATDGPGNVYITGFTRSTDNIATSGAYQTTLAGNINAYLAEFNSSGAIQWGTYYGGNGSDGGLAIVTDASGNVFITGFTTSTSGIATSDGYQTVEGDGGSEQDAFLAKFNNTGALQWATYFGGSGIDEGDGIGVDGSGNVYIAGTTGSASGIATAGAYQTTFGGSRDAILAKFIPGSLPPSQITGPATVCQGGIISLTDVSAGGVWSTPNTTVATIDGGGVVSGVGAGIAMISYTTAGGTATVTVTVSQGLPLITGIPYVAVGSTITLSDGSAGGTWGTTSGSIATIDPSLGIVGGLVPGNAVISYSTGGCPAATATITVVPANVLCVGTTVTLSDTVAGGTWASTNPACASVVTAGNSVVRGVLAGTTTIKHTATGGYLRTYTVTVNPLAVTTGTATACGGQTLTLYNTTATGSRWASDDNIIASVNSTGVVSAGYTPVIATAGIYYITPAGCVTEKTVTVNATLPVTGNRTVCGLGQTTVLSNAIPGGAWNTSNPGLATVTSGGGVVTGVVAGTPVISYTLPSGCISLATVTVHTLSPSTGNTSVCGGLTMTVYNATTGGGTWSASNTLVATVTSGGIVTGGAVAVATPANILFTTPAGCTTSKTVTINASVPITGVTNVCQLQTTTLSNAVAGGTWSSSSAGNATVTGTGIVSGVATGTPIIKYGLPSGCISSATVTVRPLTVITGSATACLGRTTPLYNSTTGGVWTSANTSLATVDASTGVLSALATGGAPIIYTTGTGCITTKTITVAACREADSAATTGMISVTTGIDNLILFPNPSKGAFTIKGELVAHEDADVSIEITDILGQLVYKSNFTAQGGTINEQLQMVNAIANSMYLVNIRSGASQKVFHIVIER